MSRQQRDDGEPITTGSLIKWGGFAVAMVGGLISVIWFAAGVKTDIAILKQTVDSNRQRIADIDAASQRRHDQQEREIEEQKKRSAVTEASVQDMARKLDVAVALLERIEAKVGGSK